MSLAMDPPAPPARRSSATSCDLHPDEAFTGFCAACLRERLAGLEASAAAASAPGRKSTSAIRPFAAAGGSGSSAPGAAEPPDLRRCKSFSCGRGGDVLSAAAAAAAARAGDEPQRRSCDVRGRSTLWALFHQDDRDRVRDGTAFGSFPVSSSVAAALTADVALPLPQPPPLQRPCVMEDFSEEDIPVVMECDEIMPVVELEPVHGVDTSGEIKEVEANVARDVKAIKDHIDLESSEPKTKPTPKDLKEIAGSFWEAASVFSKKWQKWRRKQKLKKEAAVSKAAAAAMPPPEKPSKPSFLRRRRLRGEAGSEHALGRRSCDTDPRFSLDAGRMSIDDAGFSWDEPRASWDGYLFGAGGGIGLGRAPPPLSRLPPILSVMEDAPAAVVERSDGQIPVEDDADLEPPGGTFQTRDYYLDSSSRRRRSLERSSSVRRPSFEVPEPKPIPAAAAAIGNESPIAIGGSEFYHFHHAEDLLDRGFSSNSLVEDISASLEAALSGPSSSKKPPRWRKAWSLWGFIHRRAAGRRTGGGGGGPSDIADRSFSEPWPDLRVRGGNPKMQRCNSNLSARSSFSSNSGGLGSSRRSYVDMNGNVKLRRGEEHAQAHALERNRSARHSPPGRVDNGMLRFYLTPMRSGGGGGGVVRRVGGGGLPGKAGRQLTSQSFARSVLRLY
ncbi:hypothetical protein BRADI_2g55160v3 [Brachypodium distachyon]|uniref:Uncharacterized protein n=1 Tax=Brachypodium distachyon TaxID=15368 RepID=A0A2K2DFZ7_BRADI|nr:hypothetical protein BRADI_2g55160v3 [Brachypodium distachyon]